MKKDSNKKVNNIHKMKEVIKELKKISPTLCLAKWLNTTIHLHNGTTHSCHHPKTHKIPLEEIKNDPSALHNTGFKKHQRRLMLKGKRPDECQYCWNIEDNTNNLSDRYYKSAGGDAYPNRDKILEAGATKNVLPTYVEVSFDSVCNLKCMYCSPIVSSKWMEEIKQHGPYPTTNKNGNLEWIKMEDAMPIPNKDYNPYIEAFWKWWPELYPNLHTFRITGGEPLLSKHTWRVFDWIIENPRPDMVFSINTNLSVPDDLIDRLIEYTPRLNKSVKYFEIYTSCEATGKQAEYIRFGMNYDKFMNNVDKFLSMTPNKLHFMVTFNCLSITTFPDFMRTLHRLRQKHNTTRNRVFMMVSYLRSPSFLSMRILSDDLKQKFIKEASKVIQYVSETEPVSYNKFRYEELDQMERLHKYMLSTHENLKQNQTDFVKYFDEYDRRRKTNLLETFPELINWVDDIKKVM